MKNVLSDLQFFPGNRGLSCFGEHSECRVSDVFHVSPALVSFQGGFHVLKRSEGFRAWVAKNFSRSNINWHRSAKL